MDSSPQPSSSHTSIPPNTQIRARITVVCAECKRLKLKCDRRTPCGSCVKRDTVPRCLYSAAASEKIDVQSLHNRQLIVENVLLWLLPKLGLSQDQILNLGNSGLPPEGIDFAALYASTGASSSNTDAGESSSGQTATPAHGGRKTQTNLIAFSSSPFDSSSTATDGPLASSKRSKHSASGRHSSRASSKAENASLGASSAVFGGSSVLVSLEELLMWTEHINIDLTGELSRDDDEGQADRVHIRAATSEFEQLNRPSSASHATPTNLNTLLLAVQLFLAPNGLPSSPSAPPSSFPQPGSFSPGNAQSPGMALFPTVSPGHTPSPLLPIPQLAVTAIAPGTITPVHLSQLPSTNSNLRVTLWADFENVMVSHPCLSLPDLKRRMEGMFKWGEEVLRQYRANSGQPESHGDGSSGVSSNVSSSSSGKSGSRRSANSRKTIKHPPPTLAFFAVAACAFALGSQAYAAKAAYGGHMGNAHSGYVPPVGAIPEGSARRRTTSMGGTKGREMHSGESRDRTNSMADSVAMSVDEQNGGQASGSGAGASRDETGNGDIDDAVSNVSSAPSAVKMPPPHGLNGAANGSTPHYNISSASTTPFPSSSANPTSASPSSIPFPLTGLPPLPKLPKESEPDTLHALAQAALMAHDTLNLAPSLDYIVAHILCWLFKLHAPSSTVGASEDGMRVGAGATTIDPEVWKGLGKIVNIARGMGLGVDPDESGRPSSRKDEEGEGEGTEKENEPTGMSLWEKEMRRRVWWDVCYYDLFISDCMGFPPLIDDAQHTTHMPSDVDDSAFGPSSTSLPPPRMLPTTDGTPEVVSEATNFTYFIQKCKLASLMKSMKKRTFRDPATGELSLEAAKQFQAEIHQFTKQLPREFALDFRLGSSSHPSAPHLSNPSAMDEDGATPGSAINSPYATGPSPHQYSNVFSPYGIATSTPSPYQTPHQAGFTPSGEYPLPSAFPASDILAAQACELRSMANALILKLWTPFLKASPSSSKMPNQSASLASATAAHGIVVASNHLLNRFRFVRPAAYGFYGFGKMVFHAGLVLANVVINSPEVVFAETALKGLESAIEVMKDPVVTGLGMRQVSSSSAPPSSSSGSSQDSSHQVPQPNVSQATKILELLKHAAESAIGGANFVVGNKRKYDDSASTSTNLRVLGTNGFPLPYVGGPVTTGPLPGASSGDSSRNGTGNMVGLGISSVTSPSQTRTRFASSGTGVPPAAPPAPPITGSIFWAGAESASPAYQNSPMASMNMPAPSNNGGGSQVGSHVGSHVSNNPRRRAGSTTSNRSAASEASSMSINAPKPNAAYPAIGIRDRTRTSGVKVESMANLASLQASSNSVSGVGSRKSAGGSSKGRGKKNPDAMSRSSRQHNPLGSHGHARRTGSLSQGVASSSSGPSSHGHGLPSLPPLPPPPPSLGGAPPSGPHSAPLYPTHAGSDVFATPSQQPGGMDHSLGGSGQQQHLEYPPSNGFSQPQPSRHHSQPQPQQMQHHQPQHPPQPQNHDYPMAYNHSFGAASQGMMEQPQQQRGYMAPTHQTEYANPSAPPSTDAYGNYMNNMGDVNMAMSGYSSFDPSSGQMGMAFVNGNNGGGQAGPGQPGAPPSHSHVGGDPGMMFGAPPSAVGVSNGGVPQAQQQQDFDVGPQGWGAAPGQPGANRGGQQWGSAPMNYS